MKKNIVILVCLSVGIAAAGEQRFRNETAIAARAASDVYEAGTNRYNTGQFLADIESAKNFAELKEAIAKKARSDHAKETARKASEKSPK